MYIVLHLTTVHQYRQAISRYHLNLQPQHNDTHSSLLFPNHRHYRPPHSVDTFDAHGSTIDRMLRRVLSQVTSGLIKSTTTNARCLDAESRVHSTLSQDEMAKDAIAEGRKLRILMLHGYTQSGPFFHTKTKALEKSLHKAFPPAPQAGSLQQYPGGIELYYPTAPFRLSVTDIPGLDNNGEHSDLRTEAYGWWRRKGDGEPYTYEGMEGGLERLANVLQQQGPFDGVIGFSQGGAAAGMVASLLEPGRREAFEQAQQKGGMRYPDHFTKDSGFIEEAIHPPMKFAVSYSGFAASAHPLYQAYYIPKISTPMCHFIGSADTVVDESRSLRLVDACVNGRGKEGCAQRVIYHPGGHFLPSSQKQYVAALVAFIRDIAGEGSQRKVNEEKAEDMDLPF